MGPVYFVTVWFILALLAPTGWALWGVWRRARVPHELFCPAAGAPARFLPDSWYAVKMLLLGENELRVMHCACWPEWRDCGRECLQQVGRAAYKYGCFGPKKGRSPLDFGG